MCVLATNTTAHTDCLSLSTYTYIYFYYKWYFFSCHDGDGDGDDRDDRDATECGSLSFGRDIPRMRITQHDT